jgi:exodeoxyribonuclease VII large subunit
LAVAFEQLKSRLSAEGLFDVARKRAVPRLPRRIGVVTSPSGAAIRDFLRVLHHRFPSIPVLIATARVQGEGASGDIARALRILGRWSERGETPGLDVIVLTRGGGSLEDLWAFNEEAVARAIAASPVPVISAVGHEVDFTISDFVADARAATPTAAAELVAPILVQELEDLRIVQTRLSKAIERHLRDGADELTALTRGLGDPRRRLETESLRLDDLRGRLEGRTRQRLQAGLRTLSQARETLWHAHPREQLARAERDLSARREALHARVRQRAAQEVRRLQVLKERLLAAAPQRRLLEARAALLSRDHELRRRHEMALSMHRRHLLTQCSRLDALSPLRVMERGYAIAFAQGRVVTRHGTLAPGEAITVRLGDQSEVDAQVTAARPAPQTASE